MSVPFSNTHLRVPRGFATMLEGLTREVLRDQPENIPKYAAQYFDALLKQREESGMDPAEWAAKLEDRFYNNHAFKTAKTSPERKKVTEATISTEKSDESQTEEELSYSTAIPNLSTEQPDVPEKADLTESTEEEEKQTLTEEHVSVETEGESINRIPTADIQSEEPSGVDKEEDPTITTLDQSDRSANETDSSSAPDQNIPQSSESADLLSYSGISDVCAQELGVAEDEEGDKQETTEEIADSDGEESNQVAEQVDIFPYSGLADVDVCAAELGGEEGAIEGATAKNNTHVTKAEESLKPQSEEELSQSEITEGSQQEAEKIKEEEGTETESGEIHKGLAHTEGGLDSNIIPKEDSLVEINFEDVPEAQQITEVGEKQPEEESSAEVFQTKKLEMQQKEESRELTASATDQNISDTQEHDEPDTEEEEKEVAFEGEEIESQQKPLDIMKENKDTNDSDDDEMEKGVKDTSLSDQPTTEAEKESQEDETGHKNENNEEITEAKFHQNEESAIETQSNKPDVKEDEMTEPVGEDKKETYTEGYNEVENQEINDGEKENNSSQVTQSNISMAGMAAESENFEESAQCLAEEDEESQRTLVEPEPEDTEEEKEVTSKAIEELTEGMIDSKVQEEIDVTHREENIGLSQGADWMAAENQREETPPESVKDATEPEIKSIVKEECSRPQEEEDIMDIPLDDPEANRAAAKIQAGFRGHMTRKKLKPEDKAEGEEVSSTGDVLNGSQGDSETGRSGAVERDDTSVPEQ